MDDRRKLTRYDIEDHYQVFDRVTGRKLGVMANLSIEGMMLLTENPVKKRSLFLCSVQLPQPVLGRGRIDFDGECRWCKKVKDSGWFQSGYKLVNIPVEDQTTIMCLVLQKLATKSATHLP